MNLRLTRRLPLIALLAGLYACSGGSGARRTLAVPWHGEPGTLAAPTSGQWKLVPAQPAGLLARAQVNESQTLYVGVRGERWLVDATAETAEAASDLATQTLVGVSKTKTGSWLFIGQTGAIFEAPGPLDPFIRQVEPPEPVVRATAAGSTLVAVTNRGGLLRSEDGGASFTNVNVASPFIADVAMLESGDGLALTFPERLFTTKDAGATWSPLNTKSIGATGLGAENGSISVQGMSAQLSWKPSAGIIPYEGSGRSGAVELPFKLPPSPNAAEVLAGRGVIRGDEVWVLRHGENKPPKTTAPSKKTRFVPDPTPLWQLGVAKIGGRLSLTDLAGTEKCGQVSMAAEGKRLVVACSVSRRGSPLVDVSVLIYDDVTQPPRVLPPGIEGQSGQASVALSPAGDVFVLGVCRTSSRRNCVVSSPLVLPASQVAAAVDSATAASASAEAEANPPPTSSASASSSAEPPSPWLTISAPSLQGKPLGLAFSSDGLTAYMLGRRNKSNELALFVSRNGGKVFEPRDLGVSAAPDTTNTGYNYGRPPAVVSQANFSLDTPGVVGISLLTSEGGRLLVTDEDGRLMSSSRPPATGYGLRVGVVGTRALAVDNQIVYETLDGGLNWHTLPAVGALRPRANSQPYYYNYNQPITPVVCGGSGCLVGDELGRLGWGNSDPPTRIEQDRTRLRTSIDRPQAPPLVCRLEKGKWSPLPRGASVPRAEDADRGKTTWAVISDDPAKAATSLVQVAQGSNRIDESKLFSPVTGATRVAYALRKTPEGAVAIRYKVPTETEAQNLQMKTDKNGNPVTVKMAGVEVVWANVYEGKTGRATIADAGTLAFGDDYYPNWQNPEALPFAQPSLVSTTGGGVFLKPHNSSGTETFFIDRSGKVDATFKFSDVPGRGSPILSGAVLDNKPMSIAMLGTAGVARANSSEDWEMINLGPSDEGPTGFEITQLLSPTSFNGSVYVTHAVAFKQGGRTYAEAFPLRGSGAVVGERIAMPTQTDLALAKFKPCSAADRSKSPRIVVPAEVGTQRPIVIESPDGTFQSALLTTAMVGYGTPQSPCAAVVEAFPVPDDTAIAPPPLESALVLFNDLEHSWFFRQGVAEAGVVEARQMRCKVDNNAPVPSFVSLAMLNGTFLEGGFPQQYMGE